MSNVIIIKNSSTVSDVPTVGQLEQGELAINLLDEKLYSKNSSNVIFEIGAGTIGGSIADNQIAVGAATADSIEGSANLTFDGTTLDTNDRNIDMGEGRLDVKTIYATGTTGGIVRIYGSGGTAYFSMLHNDVDINLAGLGGTVDMNITGLTAINAGSVDADFDNVTATDFNAVALTAVGSATSFLNAAGTYTTPAGTGISNVVEDGSPQLGADLDLQTFGLSGALQGTGGVGDATIYLTGQGTAISMGTYANIGRLFSNAATMIGNNVYIDSTDAVAGQVRYATTHASYGHTIYEMYAGAHYWYGDSASVTANAIVTKQSTMTLTEAGNLSILGSYTGTNVTSGSDPGHTHTIYAPIASPTFTGTVAAPLLNVNTLGNINGNYLIINAGESVSYATGQTAEQVYVNAEGGLQVNSSPDNWASLWAGRDTATICAAGGASTFPGNVTVTGNIIVTGTVDGKDVSTLTSNTGTVTGTGVNNQVSLWSGTSSQDGSANLTFSAGNELSLGTAGTISLQDNNRIGFGTGFDGQISYDSAGDELQIECIGVTDVGIYTAATDLSLLITANAGVGLYYNNVLKFLTTTAGATLTGNMTVTGTVTASGNINANGNIVGDGATTITGIEEIVVDATADIRKTSHGCYLYHASTAYDNDQNGQVTFSTAAASGGTTGDIWFQYTA